MNVITIILWIIIATIALVAIILVKSHFKGEKLEKDNESILSDSEPMDKVTDTRKSILSRLNNNSQSNHSTQLNKNNKNLKNDDLSYNAIYEEPIVYEVENENKIENIQYESENQVLINYGNTVEKFQEPIKENQMDIMSQNNNPNNEKHELKDLFTIDELIKESKRKDSEREKEARNESDEEEIDELKESIKQRQENKQDDKLIEEIVNNKEETIVELINETKEEETINDLINSEDKTDETKEEETINDLINSEDKTDETKEDAETPIVTSQDIEEAINAASNENEEEPEIISESAGITDVLLENNEEEAPKEEIKEPILKTPTKVDATEDYEFGADIDNDSTFGKYDNDLDYRKDLAKITNTIKGSKIFKDVKEKFTSEPEPIENNLQEDFIRNVNEYEDEFEPIINETHADFEATYEEIHSAEFDERIREQNSEKVFKIVNTPKEPVEQKIAPIKEKPSRDNIKITINNNEVVLKKGDEIIFNHLGETYSSKVYAINGDDISVRYRRQNITIKPSDVKKVY